jgi:hypothetical protein
MDIPTDKQGFYKTYSGAIVNKDNNELSLYKKRKAKEKRISEMDEEIGQIKNDISEIRDLLIKVLNK